MKRKKSKISSVAAWLPVAVWMVVIFLFSAQDADRSGDTSGSVVRWVVGLIHWNFDTMSQARQAEILEIWSVIVRKGAHFTEYAVLAVLISNAIGRYPLSNMLRWGIPIAASALYAVTDEVHQYFVPGRACRLLDVGIDTCGAAFGTAVFALLVFLAARYRRRR